MMIAKMKKMMIVQKKSKIGKMIKCIYKTRTSLVNDVIFFYKKTYQKQIFLLLKNPGKSIFYPRD